MGGNAPTFASLAAEYAALWARMSILRTRQAAVKAAATSLVAGQARYQDVSRRSGVPWYVVGIIHGLESTFDFRTHLHNGDPLTARTIHHPPGHPASGQPPFDWEDSAIDALALESLDKVDGWTVQRIAYELERYNGLGYRMNNLKTLSPYLWSFTDLYERGKYTADKVYDPNAVSDQVGGMALLRQLVDDGLAVASQKKAAPPKPPPPPVATGAYEADGRPFELASAIGAPTDDRSPLVRIGTPVRKIADTVDAAWWNLRLPTGETGFARRSLLRPILADAAIDEKAFAQACLDTARRYGTSAHFLVALADAETGILNTAGTGGAFGPFALTLPEWQEANKKSETGSGDEDRFDPYAQAAVAARFATSLTEELRALLPDKRLPTSEELYVARIATAAGVAPLLQALPEKALSGILETAMPAASLALLRETRPALFSGGGTVGAFRADLVARIEAGFVKAVALIRTVEPDLALGPPATLDEAKETPWMGVARKEFADGVTEFKTGSNPRIERYFAATNSGRLTDDQAWCAAFVSFCIQEAGGSSKHLAYSARAASWLSNGDRLDGPRYGAVAVLRPLAKKSSSHVGFVTAWDGGKVTLLGGNQHDAVCERDFSIADVRGWRMP